MSVLDTVVDTCCLVNLCSVEDPADFLPTFGLTWQVPRAVANEGLFIVAESDDGRALRRSIDLAACFRGKSVCLCDVMEGKEAALYVALAQRLDDGEAMALAIGKSRGWTVATDDKRGRKIAGEISVPTVTTPELIRRWAEVANLVPPLVVAKAIQRIQRFARFVPSPDFPEYDWWIAAAARGH